MSVNVMKRKMYKGFSVLNITLDSVDNNTCATPGRANKTVISNLYEGIPETIILNVICWIVLILLFAILRNRAWDYGRLALVHTEKWTQLFYKNTDDAVAVEELHNHNEVSLIADTGCLWFPPSSRSAGTRYTSDVGQMLPIISPFKNNCCCSCSPSVFSRYASFCR
ncbi:unnamed protein product [Callosobruchus maculatus]|uniref:Uncharacterized protein n=1 Tax=Callosobruchus maculatus TaxID=64391 RepID=A0A653D8I2_CALMS|nr:unnamed protein product [Callosobruchus maculatus]